MENKLERLNQLRQQKQKVEDEIQQLVAELSNLIKPRKRKSKDKSDKLPTAKL
jgi:chaperonin cofactor prefoldin